MDKRKLADRPKLWHRPKRPVNGAVELCWTALQSQGTSVHSDQCVLVPYMIAKLEACREFAYQLDRIPGHGAVITITPLAEKELENAGATKSSG